MVETLKQSATNFGFTESDLPQDPEAMVHLVEAARLGFSKEFVTECYRKLSLPTLLLLIDIRQRQNSVGVVCVAPPNEPLRDAMISKLAQEMAMAPGLADILVQQLLDELLTQLPKLAAQHGKQIYQMVVNFFTKMLKNN